MPVKSAVLDYLGETALSAPKWVSAGLAANDRAKVRMAALQLAAAPAGGAGRNLDEEARAVRLDPDIIRGLLRDVRTVENGALAAPGLSELLAGLTDDLQIMLDSVEALDGREDEALRARWSGLRPTLAPSGPDQTTPSAVSEITGLSKGERDSVHRLVMDLHKRLNTAAAAQASETIAGAKAIGLHADDRRPLEAFMRGLERTRGLKFDHPGLDTTAARSGERLLIQNDIGTTDAHVIVTAVEAGVVSVTYTDVHRARTKFLIKLLEDSGAVWSGFEDRQAQGLAEGKGFVLVTGRLETADPDRRDRFLEAIGAALVFLIDWNRARKALAGLVDKPDAIRVLLWAAQRRYGHRAWLQLGGPALIAQAVQQAAPARLGFGGHLREVLGQEGAVDFLQAALQLAAEALLQGGSERLVRDRIGAELLRRLERSEAKALAGVVRQAGLAREIGSAILLQIAELKAGREGDRARLAARAKAIEFKADRLAVEGRAGARAARLTNLTPVIDSVEQAIDELEQAAFVVSVTPGGLASAVLDGLEGLSRLSIRSAEALAIAADAAIDCPEGRQADADDALAALTVVVECERAADRAEREVFAAALSAEGSFSGLVTAQETAKRLECATDWIARAGEAIRLNLMTDLGG